MEVQKDGGAVMERKSHIIRIEELLTPREVCQIIRCSLSQVYEMAKTDLHKACVRFGGKVRFDPVILQEVIRDHTGIKKKNEHDFSIPENSPDLDIREMVKSAIESTAGVAYNQHQEKPADIAPGKEAKDGAV
jgi:hypothetical protein